MTLKVVDKWTTQHGSWDIDTRNEWGIDQAHRDKYEAGRLIDGSGADHHILVKAPMGSRIVYMASDGKIFNDIIGASGWSNFAMSRDAGYNADNGRGPWSVLVNGVKVAEGIGLPDGEHVSQFLVVEDDGNVPVPSGNQYIEIVLRTMVDGIQSKEEVLWTSK